MISEGMRTIITIVENMKRVVKAKYDTTEMCF